MTMVNKNNYSEPNTFLPTLYALLFFINSVEFILVLS